MSEQIGKVILEDSKYPGEDLYSEGSNEDRLLELVKEHEESEFNQIILTQWSWPILYHLSHIRSNIVQWLPIHQKHHVLEIGSGCGAITGMLAEKAGKVTCIELSKKRSMINAYRNKHRDNIEILLGNFEDIEQEISEQYDYILLIGVFEYAASYIHTQDPYRDFLKIVAKHLSPNGKIVIAIENKYGLKYWAGCKEDHTGKFYEGIEGYADNHSVKTFSREKLIAFAKDCGLTADMYYPYPDYKFPHMVFSDRYLPKVGELTNNLRNFDGDRVVAFDEGKVFDGLIEEGKFPFFSNSFEVILQKEDVKEEKIIYTKFSNERGIASSIRTDIVERADGTRFVRKTPFTPEAKAHVTRTFGFYDMLRKAYEVVGWKPNQCRLSEDGCSIELVYIQGEPLDVKLNRLFVAGKADEVRGYIREFAKDVESLANGGIFQMTEEFAKVFGNFEIDPHHTSARITNLDIIFSNMFWVNEEVQVIDYEWTFLFPIPVKFLIYRAVWYFLQSSGMEEAGLYAELGITGKDQEIFARMEHNFQLYIIGGRVSLTTAHALVAGLTLSLDKLVKQGSYFRDLHVVKIYYDFGQGMSEYTLHFIRAEVEEDELVHVTIPIAEGAKRLRIDPTEYPCLIKLHEFNCDGVSVKRFLANGTYLTPQMILYDTSDAQLLVWELPEDAKEIKLSYTVSMLRNDLFKEVISEVEAMQAELKMFRSLPEPPTCKEKILMKLGLKKKPEPITEEPLETKEPVNEWDIIPPGMIWSAEEEKPQAEEEPENHES